MHTLRAARDEEHILRAATAASAKDLFYLQRLRHEAAHAPRRLRPTRPPPLPEIAPDSDRLWPPLPARRDGLQRLSVVLDAARRDGLLMRRGTALSSSMQRGGKVEGDGPATPPVSSASSSRSTLAVSSASSSRSTIAVSSSSPASSASATRSLAAVGQAVGFGQAVLHAASQHTGRVLARCAPALHANAHDGALSSPQVGFSSPRPTNSCQPACRRRSWSPSSRSFPPRCFEAARESQSRYERAGRGDEMR